MTKPKALSKAKDKNEAALEVMRTLTAQYVDLLDKRWQDKNYLRGADVPQLDTGAATDNPYWEAIRRVKIKVNPPGAWMDQYEIDWFGLDDGPMVRPVIRRDDAVKLYGWTVPTPADLAWILEQLMGRNVVEIGAGAGYWAWQFSQLGVDVMAYDNWEWEHPHKWHDVLTGTAEYAGAFPDRVLMLIWPPYDNPMAVDALRAFPGDTLIYAGEPYGGCTGDDDFHELLEAEWDYIGRSPGHPTFEGIHCHVEAYRRKAVK